MTNRSYITYLPYIRYGLNNSISENDTFAATDGNSIYRQELSTGVTVKGRPIATKDTPNPTIQTIGPNGGSVNKTVQLIGPGDILGIDRAAIIRTSPLINVNSFEPNYLPYIDFYDEDFLWRYTPAKANFPTTPPAANNARHTRLRPWITLVTLSADEFEKSVNPTTQLPTIVLKKAPHEIFPNPAHLWAWAHVQINKEYTNLSQFQSQFNTDIRNNPDLAISRLLCPRNLKPKTKYYAFVIPTFETGRLAGLGFDASNEKAQKAAWDFSTNWPPSNLTQFNKEYPVYYEWHFETGNDEDFESLVKQLKPSYLKANTGSRTLYIGNSGIANLDSKLTTNKTLTIEGILKPIIADNSNNFDSEWNITPAQTPPRLNQAYVTELCSLLNVQKETSQTNPQNDPVIALPLYGRWHAMRDDIQLSSQNNWYQRFNLDPRYRAIAGIGADVVRRNQDTYLKIAWSQVDEIIKRNNELNIWSTAELLEDAVYQKNIASLNDRELVQTAATLNEQILMQNNQTIAANIRASAQPSTVATAAYRRNVRPRGPLMKRLFATNQPNVSASIVNQINQNTIQLSAPYTAPAGQNTITTISATQFSAAHVQSVAYRPNFVLSQPGSIISFSGAVGTQDSAVAVTFRAAIANTHQHIGSSPALPAPPPAFDFEAAATVLRDRLKPSNALLSLINKIRKRVQNNTVQPPFTTINRVMAAPAIAKAMYKPLCDLSTELLLPGLRNIDTNTVTLLQSNQKMMEAYMLGINHEMSRELLWKGYPTDLRGTYFRHFWDFATDFDTQSFAALAANPNLMDIKPIHDWKSGNTLTAPGANSSRNSNPQNQIILTIRGELIRKYPDAVFYAAKAIKNAQNKLVYNEVNDFNLKNTDLFRPHLFSARVDDVLFVGFDLPYQTARGTGAGTDLGWFFIIEQRMSEPIFGAAKTGSSTIDLESWADLSWNRIGAIDGQYIDIEVNSNNLVVVNNLGDINRIEYQDKAIKWNTNSSEMAYALHRNAVRIAIHAGLMLPNLPNNGGNSVVIPTQPQN